MKKFGITMVLLGAVLLLGAFISFPLGAAKALTVALGVGGCALMLLAAPLMWRDGIRAIRQGKAPRGTLLAMRQSGFFDIVIAMLVLALVLGILWGIGGVSYQSTLHYHASLAAGDGEVPTTLEEARKLPDFVEYNFKQDLNMLSGSYASFGVAALVFLGMAVIALLYMALISPVVRADDSLRLSHKVYRKAGQYTAAVLVTLLILFPIYWMIISSFKTSTELLQTVPTLWPANFVWENYPNVLNRAPFFRYLLNTLVTTFFIMLGQLVMGILAAYGFSKGEFKGRNVMFMLVLGALMVPIQVTFVPIYVLISRLNSIDTWMGVILPNLVSAYFIFMLRQNFMAVDNSYIEAGKIDGMGRIGTIVHVLCPMCKPTLITVSIISFIDGWNSYFWPKMVTKTEASRTIAVGVQQLKNTFAGQEVSNYNEIMAGAVMAIIPIVFLFLVLQKYIMTGMSKAAMK
ncbi:MAG: carbohydrate ABC transporter permease [Clostridia bacterium]|nr:carbohydrate ABC transporter permease [Clostridia bacterium]